MCVLFLDLVKAFDKALREIVFGLPAHVRREEGVTYLVSLGLSEDDAVWVKEYSCEDTVSFADPYGYACFDWNKNCQGEVGSLLEKVLVGF